MKTKKLLAILLAFVFVFALLPAAASAAEAVDVSAYDALVTELARASTNSDSPTKIKLTEDITSTARLTVGSGTYVTLDLNGKKIDRGLTAASENGSVILVQGTLVIEDNSTGQPGQITGGFSSENSGGVYVGSGGTLDLRGGTISGNKVAGGYGGGGVYVESGGTFTMSGSATISGNSVTGSNNGYDNGGGVYVGGTFNMTGGTIANNTTTGAGGGVMIVGAFNMSGGSITGNEASRGGGVWLNYGSMTLSGGSITGNTAESQGGGVVIPSQTTFKLSGNPIVTGNTVTGGKPQNLWLGSAGGSSYYSDPMITVTGELTEGASIGVTLDESRSTRQFTNGFKGNNPDTKPAAFFTSDDSNYYVGDAEEGVLSRVTTYPLWVGGTQVTSANAGNLADIEGVSGTAKYEPESNTLYLENAAITGSGSDSSWIGIGYEGEPLLTIQLTGENSIVDKATNRERGSDCIYIFNWDLVEAPLAIKGPGSLTITSADVSSGSMGNVYSSGIDCYGLTISDGAVLDITAGSAVNTRPESGIASSKGIFASPISISGSGTKVTVRSGSASALTAVQSYGIVKVGSDVERVLTVSDGAELTASTASADDNACAILFDKVELGGAKAAVSVNPDGTGAVIYDPDTMTLSDYKWFSAPYEVVTVTLDIRCSNNATGTVEYMWDNVDAIHTDEWSESGTADIPMPDGAAKLIVKVRPAEEYYINQQNGEDGTGTYTDKAELVAALLSSDGAVFEVTENATIVIEFDNWDGVPGEEPGDEPGEEPGDEPADEPEEPEPYEPEEPAAEPLPFEDVPEDAYYYDAVAWAVENGVTTGTSDTTFTPDGTCTRAQIVTFLWRIAGEPAASGENPFADVEEGKWYTEAVLWAAENGIVLGYGDGTFGPEDEITREQFATILYRCVQLKGGGFTGLWYFELEYEDAADISDWADEAMHWCVMNGIINGRTETTLEPGATATRAESVVMLMRFVESLED